MNLGRMPVDHGRDPLEVPDFRRLCSETLAHALVREIDDLIEPDKLKEVHIRLFEALYENSMSWLTPEDRKRLGLEPVDELGWTPSERVKREQELKNLLMMAQTPNITTPVN